jgi:hypothetical protein
MGTMRSAHEGRAMPKINLQYKLSDDFLKSVLVSALESGVHGVQSWATFKKIEEGTPNDYSAVLLSYDKKNHAEGSRRGRVIIGLGRVAQGIERLLQAPIGLGNELRGRLAVAVISHDAGHIDGPLADCIIQAAIFDDVIYG